MSELLYTNHLKELREKAGLSLQGLADCLGCSKTNIWELEKATANPTLKTAYSIAAVLDVPVIDIWTPQVQVVEETITVRRIRGV
jgi:DNA-binding XRE family transcriptional regulator